MKILIISPFFYPHIGGSQVYMENIYAFLIKKQPKIKAEVLCYNTDHTGAKSLYRGLTIHRIACFNILKGQFALPHPVELIQFLWKNRQNFDLYHCSTRFFDSSVWAPLWGKFIKKPVILTDHCASHPVHKNILVCQIAKLLDLSLFKLSLHLFSKVIATNKATQRFLKAIFNTKTQIIYGGVDTKIFKPSKKTVGSKVQVVFVGRMIDTKGAKHLFQTAQKIKEANFVFAGPGPLANIFKNEVKRQRISNIKIAGPLNKIQVSSLLKRSDIFVYPSYHHEGFPNSLLEAGATKLAVIATDTGGSKEIILNNKTGLLIEPNNPVELEKALLKLIKTKSLRKRLSQNLYYHIQKNFTWEKLSTQLEQLLAEILHGT